MNISTAPVVVGSAALAFVELNPAAVFSGLSDVSISSPANNDFIQYQTSDSKYHNRTAAQAAASLPAFTGDSGSGGVKGLVPAPAAGDAAANLFLSAAGGFVLPYIWGWHYPASFSTTAVLPACAYNNGSSGVGATLTGNSNGALAAQDGITPVVGYRLLVKNQASAFQNGIYVVTQVGDGTHPFILTRATDFNSPNNINQGDVVVIGPHGTTNGGEIFQITADASPIVVGTTNFTWATIGGGGAISSAAIDTAFGSTRGAILYRGASGWTILAPGTSGNVLTSNGSGADPSYSNVTAAPAGQGADLVYLGTTTAAGGSANLDFTGFDPTVYRYLEFRTRNLHPNALSGAIFIYLGTGATPTWQTTGYNGDTKIQFAGSNQAIATTGDVTVNAVVSRNGRVQVNWSWFVGAGNYQGGYGIGVWTSYTSGNEITAVRLTTQNSTWNSGGIMDVYGRK